MKQITVEYSTNGSTRTAVLRAPHVSTQMVDGGIHVVLGDRPEYPTGFAMFTAGGVVAWSGSALDQYRPQAAEA